ncbi:MAG: radical SAM protein [Candidatus Diapherotrites archaeon]|nr:radical SAM protein [Candidatus Diapherotrites archaeon]
MKVCLLHPEFTIYFTYEGPIGLAYLQACLKEKGHEVKIIDNNVLLLPHEKLIEELRNCDAVGITMTTPTYKTVKAIAEKVKKELRIPVILGGPHPTIAPLDCLDFSDFVISGEGEKAFPELAEVLGKTKSRKLLFKKLKKIKNISFNWNGKKIQNKREAFIEDLDKLPFPDWNGFPIEKYGSALRTSGKSLPIITSRGCPYSCVYCFKGLFGLKYRVRSAKNVVAELEHLKKEFGIREFQIADDCFTLLKPRAIEICKRMIEKKINLPWSLPNGIRADTITDELAQWMKKSGLEYTGLGIESGSQKILDSIGKVQKKETVREAVKILKKNKIKTVGFFMFGLPGETLETMKETVQFAKELDLDYCSISMTTPYPGTRLFDEIKNGKGTLLTKSPEDLFSLGSKVKYTMPGMALPEEIEQQYRKARMVLLLRPKTILKNLKDPKKLIAGAKVAYKWLLKT